MKHISIIEKSTREAIQLYAKKHDLESYFRDSYTHPQEDFLLVSDPPKTFVVSDGVTLDTKILARENVTYPNPSPSGEVAKIFCHAVLEGARTKYSFFEEQDILSLFHEANEKVGKYNRSVGASKISGNLTGLFAATGSFIVLKEKRAYWASICDSFVAHFDKHMKRKFISSGSCSPYAVINGEDKMSDHLEYGTLHLAEGDRIFLYTDGFEFYFENSIFLNFFVDWSGSLEEQIGEFSQKMNKEDPEKYGQERSLIGILV